MKLRKTIYNALNVRGLNITPLVIAFVAGYAVGKKKYHPLS